MGDDFRERYPGLLNLALGASLGASAAGSVSMGVALYRQVHGGAEPEYHEIQATPDTSAYSTPYRVVPYGVSAPGPQTFFELAAAGFCTVALFKQRRHL